MKIDDGIEDDDEKDYYDDDLKGADDLPEESAPTSEDATDDDIDI